MIYNLYLIKLLNFQTQLNDPIDFRKQNEISRKATPMVAEAHLGSSKICISRKYARCLVQGSGWVGNQNTRLLLKQVSWR